MDIKYWFMCRKYRILLTVLILAIFFIVGCASGNGNAPPPSGPIGGGC